MQFCASHQGGVAHFQSLPHTTFTPLVAKGASRPNVSNFFHECKRFFFEISGADMRSTWPQIDAAVMVTRNGPTQRQNKRYCW